MIPRRRLLRQLGATAAAAPFLGNLASLQAEPAAPKRRLVVVFSPNGVVRDTFWPGGAGDLPAELPPILRPLAPFRDRLLTLKGVCDKIRGDGDAHLRGMGCLLTGVELLPGNIQGGGDTPAGWSSGKSIDQEIRSFLQSRPDTQTRFGSLEFGVLVPERADPWTRMVYAGPNKPVAPIDDPYQMFAKLYGQTRDRDSLRSVLDDVREDLSRVAAAMPAEDRRVLEDHVTLVRSFEKELAADRDRAGHAVPPLEPGVLEQNDRMPRISRMQIDLLVAALAADFARVATLQYTNSVGQPQMNWVGVTEKHHELSHESKKNAAAQEKLTRINAWYAGEVAHLARRLAETPEPGGTGSMLDHTTIVWTNELGEGNTHLLDDIPWVLIGGAGVRGGRALEFPNVPHNRLLLALAHAMGHDTLASFGNRDYCGDGPLGGLT